MAFDRWTRVLLALIAAELWDERIKYLDSAALQQGRRYQRP